MGSMRGRSGTQGTKDYYMGGEGGEGGHHQSQLIPPSTQGSPAGPAALFLSLSELPCRVWECGAIVLRMDVCMYSISGAEGL